MGYIVGVDEVGRGCLAGPLLVVAARAKAGLPEGLHDSKLLSRKQRIKILKELSCCCEFSEGWVKAVEIDKLGLSRALKLGVRRALVGLDTQTEEEVIMDGKVNYIPKKYKLTQCLIGADNLIPIVSAASIYAKVTRDNYMFRLAKRHPRYSFEHHVGYGTLRHKNALKSFGALRFIHRTTFRPVSEVII